jgi:uncharacterized membrane protein YfcA
VTQLSILAYCGAGFAAAAAGAVNAIGGGGSLISFPVISALGVPPVTANATNTVALCPGYIGGTIAQRDDLGKIGPAARLNLYVAAGGGLLGSVLLSVTSNVTFRALVPWLILMSSVLLLVQDRLRAWLVTRTGGGRSHRLAELGALAVACTYGGYFGAGLGILIIAVLGIFSELPFVRLNAMKQLISFVVNIFAAAFLLGAGTVNLVLVAVMAPASLVGGNLGGRYAKSMSPRRLRIAVICFGAILTLVYFLR